MTNQLNIESLTKGLKTAVATFETLNDVCVTRVTMEKNVVIVDGESVVQWIFGVEYE